MQNWRFTTIGDISEVVTKGTTPTSIGFKYIESGVNFVKVETIDSRGQFLPSKFAHIDNDCNEALKRSQLKSGDILFSIAGALGRTARVTPDILPANTNQALAIIRLKRSHEVIPEFILHALSSGILIEQIERQRGGVAQQNLSLAQVKSFQIPLPPIAEQKRIVGILDEAFEGIDRAIAHTQKNLANARELFESYLNAIFTQKGDGWVEKKLQDILIVQPRNGWSPPAQNHSDTGTPVLTLSSVTGFQFNKNKIKFTNATTKKDAHYWLKNGEFLSTRSNTTELVGHVAICEGLIEPTICCDLIMKMKIDPNQAETRFVYWHFRTHALRELISSSAQGANPTMKKINKNIVQNLPVFLPAINIQKDIVYKVDTFECETQRLETIYQQKLAALNELKQSILQKAFTGELTADSAEPVTQPCRRSPQPKAKPDATDRTVYNATRP